MCFSGKNCSHWKSIGQHLTLTGRLISRQLPNYIYIARFLEFRNKVLATNYNRLTVKTESIGEYEGALLERNPAILEVDWSEELIEPVSGWTGQADSWPATDNGLTAQTGPRSRTLWGTLSILWGTVGSMGDSEHSRF